MVFYGFCPARALRRAESARAVTGRRCHHSGRGKTFWRANRIFFTKTVITQERKVEKSISRWEKNRLSEGYKWVVDQNWGRMAKKIHFLVLTMFWPRTEKVVQRKKKYPFLK